MDKNQENSNSEFTPPRHWIGTEELTADYWSDPNVREKRGQEFHDKPIEVIDYIDKMDSKGIARRDFLTLMGAATAMAGFACARRPVHKIIPYVIKPEEVTPGVANFYASTCPETGYGVLIKTREGRPIKIEGNPEHPLNRGRLSARSQSALLRLYDPDRLTDPMVRNRADSSSRKVSWSEADSAILAKLKGASAGAGRVRVLTGAVAGDSTRRLIREFTSAFGAGTHVEYEAFGSSEVAQGQNESYGTAVVPAYHFDKARVVVSLGADFLGTWISPVEYARDWIQNRKLAGQDSSKFSKLYCFESTFSVTGANADERYAVQPGDELKIALALAHEIIVVMKRSRFSGDGAVTSKLAGYTIDTVTKEVSFPGGSAKLRAIARDLAQASGASLIVAGGPAAQTADAAALQAVANLLNSALDNDGATVDGTANADIRPGGDFKAVSRLVSDMRNGSVDVLVIARTNPAFTLPQAMKFMDAVKKVPFVVVISDRDDETAQFADFVLPDHHYLENWGDARPRKGVYSLQQPAIAPMHNTRALEESLLAWVRGGALRAGGLASQMAAKPADQGTWHDYLKASWRDSVFKDHGRGQSFEKFWEETLRLGVLDASTRSSGSSRSFRSSSLASVPKLRPATSDLKLAIYSTVGMHDGRDANNPWIQELPEPITTVTWDNYAMIAPALATKLNVLKNDVIEVTTDQGSIELPVYVQPGMHASVIAIPAGYGRRNVGKVGNGVGLDVFPLASANENGIVYSGLAVKARKTGRVYRLAETQWHNASENRPIINDVTLAQYKANPKTENHTDPHLRMKEVPTIWPKYEYPNYRWGMAIDLTSCIGCSACVIACQAENNIPSVGRDNVRVSREMHWIRIDRYYSGTPESPDVIFQPMLCQHCENAPCETVCPVLATVHDDEGTNQMVYNRCVGTRYCQNNCPYKVRRFNFFDHWKSYEGTANLAWNPDVTVRSRGVMEKCTFCIQRVKDARHKAMDQGRKIKDGDFQTACQQTCPTDAIVFGNVNDPESRVAKLRKDQRSFKVLEVLNTEPMISYLSKVRNKEGESAHGHA